MSNEEIIAALKSGEALNFGANVRNKEVCEFMDGLHQQGLITLEDMGLSQETRLIAKWVGTQEPRP